jgi:hypothetical protein
MRTGTKLLTGIALALGVGGISVWGSFLWTGHIHRAKMGLQQNRFVTTRSKYEALVPQWRTLHPALDECGRPAPPPGLVRYAAVNLPSDGGYRIAGNTPSGEESDRTVQSVEEAAAILHAPQSDLRHLIKQMSDLSVTGIYQHESELSFVQDDDATLGVMFIPAVCPQASNYKLWSTLKSNIPFASLKRLSEGWYFYQANR